MARPLTRFETYVSSAVWNFTQGRSLEDVRRTLGEVFAHLNAAEIESVIVTAQAGMAAANLVLGPDPTETLERLIGDRIGPAGEVVVDVLVSWGPESDPHYRNLRISLSRTATVQELQDKISSGLLDYQLEYDLDVGTTVWTPIAVYG